MSRTRIVVSLSLLGVLPLCLFGQGYMQDVGSGQVDWTKQVVQSTGIGAPNVNLPLPQQRAGAIRAAKLDALRTCLKRSGIT